MGSMLSRGIVALVPDARCSASNKQAQLITMHSQEGLPDKGRAIEQLVAAIVCCSMTQINDLWDGSQRKGRGLVSSCGQDGYRAQVPK